MAADVETVTVIRAAGRDKFGDPLPGVPAEFDSGGWRFAPGASAEFTDGANGLTVDGALYGPPDADVKNTDRVRVRGDLYEVVGFPEQWGSFGTVVHLKRITG